MKKPAQELVDAFFQWYRNNEHSKHEDFYRELITYERLSGLTREQFIEFFFQFAREGGKVQSGGHRSAPAFKKTMEAQYADFKKYALDPFAKEFDEAGWLHRLSEFRGFGKGIATIYLNRVDKKRFAIVNNKSADAVQLLGVELPTDLVKRYVKIRNAQQQLIDWYPQFDNYFRTDSLCHFLIGEPNGQVWARSLKSEGSESAKRYWVYAPGEQARFWDEFCLYLSARSIVES